MTTEDKALALVNEVCAEWEVNPATEDDMDGSACFSALTRAIEAHEAYRQEVSDAVFDYFQTETNKSQLHLCSFIIPAPKPDPLAEAWQMAFPGNHIEDAQDECAKISAALSEIDPVALVQAGIDAAAAAAEADELADEVDRGHDYGERASKRIRARSASEVLKEIKP